MVERIGLKAVFELREYLRAMTQYTSKLEAAGVLTAAVAQRMGQQYVGLGGTVAKFAGKAGLALAGAATAAGAAVVALGADSLKTSISLESAFAGVVKTTDGLTSSFGVLNEAGAELKQGFIDLSKDIPVAAEELMRIGELGGQLGIAKNALLEFTQVIADIGTATDLTTEEAAVGFAQFMNVMGTAQTDVDRLGSAIVDLGNNFATNEPQILAFGQRIAGAGRIAGLTEGEVLGIGAAMASVGIEADAGGTAVQKVLLAMNTAVVEGNEQLAVFAETAGMSADEFARAWEEDAGAVFEAFVRGLGEQGDQAIMTLGKLELKDQRLMRAFLSLAKAGDLLGNAMDRSRDAWAENTALAEEAAQRYATTESKMTLLKNAVRALKGQIGDVLQPALRGVLDLFAELAEKYGPMLVEFFEKRIGPAIATAAEAFGQLLGGDVTGALETAFGEEVAGRILEIAASVRELVTSVATFVQEHAEGFKAALIALGALLAGAVIAAGIAAIGTALSGIGPVILAISAAVGVLAAAWAEDWGGIRTFLTSVWEGTLQPAFQAISAWLSEKIPAAMGALRSFWEGTLQPAFQAIAGWLGEKIPAAVAAVVSWWQERLLPAIQAVSTFISEKVAPILQALAGVYLAVVGKELEALSGLWQNVIQPMFAQLRDNLRLSSDELEWLADAVEWVRDRFAAMWRYVDQNVLPIYRALWELIKGPLGEAAQWWANTVLENWRRGFEGVGRAIDGVVGWLNRMKEKIAGIQLPAWLTPGSPTPFELGLRGIGEAMRELTAVELPRFAATLELDTARAGARAMAPAMMAGAQGGGVTSNYNLTINSSAPVEDIVSDFRMMEAFA